MIQVVEAIFAYAVCVLFWKTLDELYAHFTGEYALEEPLPLPGLLYMALMPWIAYLGFSGYLGIGK